jgi:hypothetical protein
MIYLIMLTFLFLQQRLCGKQLVARPLTGRIRSEDLANIQNTKYNQNET